MIAYASRTGTKRNLAAMRKHGWGILVCATGVHRREGFDLWALDNGAFTAYQQGTPFDADKFEALCEKHGDGAQFVVVPDTVAGGAESLAFSLEWLPRIEHVAMRRLIAVQDGMTPDMLTNIVGPSTGIFLGGTTEWKLATIQEWGDFCRFHRCYYHVGRVNSARRIRLCHLARANSFDGTSVTRFANTIHILDRSRRQPTLPFGDSS